MEKRTLHVVAIVSALVFVGMVGVTVVATGDDGSNRGAGLMAHLHGFGERMHRQSQHHDRMAELIEQLNLTPEQRAHLDRVHELMSSRAEGQGPMVELHNTLMGQVKQGRVESRELRRVIDHRIEQTREMLYSMTDELTALVNGLDANQREIVMQHIQAVEEKAQRHAR